MKEKEMRFVISALAAMILVAAIGCDTLGTIEVPDEAVECYLDRDGDGYGGEAIPFDLDENDEEFCDESLRHSWLGGDCSDAFADIGPGAPELCNGIDDNCNDAIDEDCDEAGDDDDDDDTVDTVGDDDDDDDDDTVGDDDDDTVADIDMTDPNNICAGNGGVSYWLRFWFDVDWNGCLSSTEMDDPNADLWSDVATCQDDTHQYWDPNTSTNIVGSRSAPWLSESNTCVANFWNYQPLCRAHGQYQLLNGDGELETHDFNVEASQLE